MQGIWYNFGTIFFGSNEANTLTEELIDQLNFVKGRSSNEPNTLAQEQQLLLSKGGRLWDEQKQLLPGLMNMILIFLENQCAFFIFK